jgi:hypothetical protein
VINLPVKKLGSREFLAFADGLVPIDDVRAIHPGAAGPGTAAVELKGDTRPFRTFREAPAPAPAPRPAAGR